MKLGRLLFGFLIIILCELISRYLCNLFAITGILYICIYCIILSFAFAAIYFPDRRNMLKSKYFYRDWAGTFIILFIIEFVFMFI